MDGANIGTRGAGKLEFFAQNYPAASSEGHLLADGLNDWLKKGLALSSFDSETLFFETIRINPSKNKMGWGTLSWASVHPPLVYRLICKVWVR